MAELTNEQVLEKTLQAVAEKFEKVKGETVSKADYEALKSEIEKVKGMQNTAELETKFAEKIKAMEKGLFDISAKLEESEPANKPNAIIEKLKSIGTSLKTAVSGAQGMQNLEVEKTKGAAEMLFSTNVTGTIPQAVRDAGINNVARQSFILEDLSNSATIAGNTVEWVEQTAIEGGAEMTAEGATKPLWDNNWVVQSTTLKKAAVRAKLSKEMVDDIPAVMSEINGNLLYQLGYVKENQILTGTGLTKYTSGISKYAKTLTLASLANTFAKGKTNRWDVIGAAVTQILTNLVGSATPNIILLSPADYFLMVHGSRSTDNTYIQPITISQNGAFYNGIPIRAHVTIPAGKFLVADMTKYNLRNRGQVEIMIGFDGNDFSQNMVTVIAEQRYAGYVKANDVEAFVYDTFANATLHLERNT